MKVAYGKIKIVVKDSAEGVEIATIENPKAPAMTFYSTKFEGASTALDLGVKYAGKLIVANGNVFIDQGSRLVYMGELAE